jgi:putative sigma-54 modulation protein
MIKKIDISGVHADVDNDIRKYIVKKISRLDKYMPRHARKSVHVDVKLKETKSKDKKRSTCEVVMHVPGETITAQDTALNMYAAVDIVEQKIRTQLKRYKSKSLPTNGSKENKVRRYLGKFVPRR